MWTWSHLSLQASKIIEDSSNISISLMESCRFILITLQGINISHLGKFGKSSTQNAIFWGDMYPFPGGYSEVLEKIFWLKTWPRRVPGSLLLLYKGCLLNPPRRLKNLRNLREADFDELEELLPSHRRREHHLNYTHVKKTAKWYPSWWFQPIWKILVKVDHFPR